MGRSTPSIIAGLIIALACGVAPASPAVGGATHHDRQHHFSISYPASWIVIPQTHKAQLALAQKLKSGGNATKAAIVAAYASDTSQLVQGRVFDATRYPKPAGPIATDVDVEWHPLPAKTPATNATLHRVFNSLVSALKKEAGVSLAPTSAVALRAGPSYLVYGTVPEGGGLQTGFASYFLISRHGLYRIDFRTDANQLSSDAQLFQQIAGTFRLN